MLFLLSESGASTWDCSTWDIGVGEVAAFVAVSSYWLLSGVVPSTKVCWLANSASKQISAESAVSNFVLSSKTTKLFFLFKETALVLQKLIKFFCWIVKHLKSNH